MGNNATLIPKQPARHSLLTSTENVVYMPLASKHTHGIVKIGDGLNIDSSGLLSVDFTANWYTNIENDVASLKLNINDIVTNVLNISESLNDYDVRITANENNISGIIDNSIPIGDINQSFKTKGAKISGNTEGEIAIGPGSVVKTNGLIAIGKNSSAGFDSIAIGSSTKAESGSIAIGPVSSAGASESLAIGYYALAKSPESIQLGRGTNTKTHSLQIFDYNILDLNGKLYTNDGNISNVRMVEVATKEAVDQNTEDIATKANIKDLENYYTKDQTYNKEQINSLIVPTQGLTKEVVDELPTENISLNTLYLVPKQDAAGNDYYDEYLYISNQWELVGTTQTNLSGYVTTEEYNKLVNNEVQIKNVDGGFNAGGISVNTVNNNNILIGKKGSGYLYDTKNVVIGNNYKCTGSVYSGVLIGNDASIGGTKSIAIGYGAEVNKASNAIQLGTGTNVKDNTLQIANDNIYNLNTHTLTVQNIELNGEDLASKLENAGGATITNINDTITKNKFENIVKLSDTQYQELLANGTLTIGEETLVYDDNTIYITPTAEGGTSVDTSNLVIKEDFDKLVNNEIQIKTSNSGFMAGGANAPQTGGIAIGYNSNAVENAVAIGYSAQTSKYASGVAIGRTSSATSGIGIGNSAKSTASKAIQLGSGTNNSENTLQIYTDNIYNHNTHTLTVQNIELNSVDLGETLNEITPKVMRALLTPVSAPSKTELVAVDSTNSQIMIEIGDGLVLENGSLKADTSYPEIAADGVAKMGYGDRVVESYISSDDKTWYRKWASGWKEVGFNRVGSGLDWQLFTLTFPNTTFTDVNTMNVTIGINGANSNDGGAISALSGAFFEATTTSIKIHADYTWVKSVYICGF